MKGPLNNVHTKKIPEENRRRIQLIFHFQLLFFSVEILQEIEFIIFTFKVSFFEKIVTDTEDFK